MKLSIIVHLGQKTPATAQRQIVEKLAARSRGKLLKLSLGAGNTLQLEVESALDAGQMRSDLNAALRRNKTTTAYVRSCEAVPARQPKLLVIASRMQFAKALPTVQASHQVFNGLRF